MPDAQASLISLTAAGAYFFALLACLTAAAIALRQRQQIWHMRIWVIIAALYLGFAVVRAYGLEEAFRDELRAGLRGTAAYSERGGVQRPLSAAVIGLALGIGSVWLVSLCRKVRGRRNLAVIIAGASAGGHFCLLALRLISLHQIDAVLYGPLKLNWILDVGATLTVLAAAFVYVRTVRQHRGSRPR